MKGFGAFVVGAVFGAAVLVILDRFKDQLKVEDAEALSERISKQLEKLEKA